MQVRARRSDEGFTLIELLTVVMIIGILATIAVPLLLSQREKARNGAAKSDLRNLITAQEAYLTSSPSEAYTVDGPSLAGEGAGFTDGVTHAVCLHDGANGVGDSAYVVGTIFEGSDTAYIYDSSVGLIQTRDASVGDIASDVVDDEAACPDPATSL